MRQGHSSHTKGMLTQRNFPYYNLSWMNRVVPRIGQKHQVPTRHGVNGGVNLRFNVSEKVITVPIGVCSVDGYDSERWNKLHATKRRSVSQQNEDRAKDGLNKMTVPLELFKPGEQTDLKADRLNEETHSSEDKT